MLEMSVCIMQHGKLLLCR